MNNEMLGWLREKLSLAETAARAREQMAQTWRTGTEKEWRQAGCKMSKEQRAKESAMQGRIAAAVARDVQMFRAAIALVEKSAPNTPVGPGKRPTGQRGAINRQRGHAQEPGIALPGVSVAAQASGTACCVPDNLAMAPVYRKR